jgi:hypothetical protein
MRITVDLKPEVERGLLAQAQSKRVFLTDYLKEIGFPVGSALGEARVKAVSRI